MEDADETKAAKTWRDLFEVVDLLDDQLDDLLVGTHCLLFLDDPGVPGCPNIVLLSASAPLRLIN